jgi:outer membrane protein OmpA-like peptidoglycan-associated protein/tetratricopeptide (TPR) repeat protein
MCIFALDLKKIVNMEKKCILLVIFIVITSVLLGQNTKKADKAFSGGRYYEAIQEYNLLEGKITDPPTLSHITFSIAESYRRMNQPEKAESYYVKAIKGGYMLPDVYFGYGEVLLNLAKYDEAKKQFEIFKRSNPENKLVDAKIASCEFAKAHRMENSKFKLQPMETLNTKGSEYGVAYFNDNLIYASTGNPIEYGTKPVKQQIDISPRTGLPYSKFYMSVSLNNTYNKGESVVGLNKGNSRKNEGTFAYDPVNNLGYYTRCTGESKNEQCYIYFAEFKNNQWKEIDNLKIENRSEPIGHPFVSSDGKRIYFVSVMEGGYGKSDIWYTDKLFDGSWTKPINLGREVNTSGNEMFPFVAGEYLFFSSDGHPGYGGMDIFASKIDGNLHGTAINLGLPFNSSHDDVNLIEKNDFSEGMLVSSRRSANNDDIFKFEGYPSALTASGKIYDSLTQQPMPGVAIDVKKDGKIVEKLTSDENGNYVFYIEPDSMAYELTTSVLRYNPITRTYHSINERFDALKGWDLPMKSSEAYISGIITGVEESRDKTRTNLGPLANVKIEVRANGEAIKLLETDANGQYRFGGVKENTTYIVKATVGNGDEFFSDFKKLEVGDIPQSIEYCKANGQDMDMELIKIAENIRLDNILYETAKWDLLPASYVELDKLVELMNKNPTLIIQIRSHTDSRGSVKSNQKLSENRAKSVVDYLISKNISPARLQSKGYGESMLLVKPERTDYDLQLNRRTEFTVIGTTGEALWDTRLTVTPSIDASGVRQIQDTPQQQYPQQTVTMPQTARTTANIKDMPFTIQVAAINKPANMNSSDFLKIKQLFNLDVYFEFSGGIYRYYAGGFNTAAEARAMCDRINQALGKSEKEKFFVKPRK